MSNETRAEFELRYKSEFPQVQWGKTYVAVPCTCEDGGGPTHWCAVRKTEEAIRDHVEHENLLADLRSEEPDA